MFRTDSHNNPTAPSGLIPFRNAINSRSGSSWN